MDYVACILIGFILFPVVRWAWFKFVAKKSV